MKLYNYLDKIIFVECLHTYVVFNKKIDFVLNSTVLFFHIFCPLCMETLTLTSKSAAKTSSDSVNMSGADGFFMLVPVEQKVYTLFIHSMYAPSELQNIIYN